MLSNIMQATYYYNYSTMTMESDVDEHVPLMCTLKKGQITFVSVNVSGCAHRHQNPSSFTIIITIHKS